jgi:GNAT superfamily N-acetyltransferase
MVTKEQYLADPCAAASIPYWKARAIAVPDGMKILYGSEYDPAAFPAYWDEPYFRLIHTLEDLTQPTLPQGYSLGKPNYSEYAAHINSCYDRIGVTESELQANTLRPVYDPSLWLAIRENHTGAIVATGIAELDREIREGALEWIQVSPSHRGRGLGRYLVSELLWRLKPNADFVTVSGQCGNPTHPEALYRKCGFTGDHVWHILRKHPV